MSKNGKGGGTTETTQSTSYAPWISGAQQAALGIALGQNLPFLQAPAYSHAGFNPDQMRAFDMARGMALDYGGSNSRTPVPSPGSYRMTAASANPGFGGSASMQAAQAGPARAGSVQLGARDFEPFMSPYLDSVADTTIDAMRRERDNNRAAIGARSAASGGFGGSGAAIEGALNDRNFTSEAGRMVAQLRQQGFDTATANALANTNLRQQTELQNAGFEQQALQANADRQQQANSTNAGYQQQALQSNADRRQQSNLFNAGNEQEARMANIDNMLRSLGLSDQMMDSDLARRLAVLNALMGAGNMQQDDMQTQLGRPYEALARLYGFIPPVYDVSSVGTQPNNSPGFMQQLLGAGSFLAGQGGLSGLFGGPGNLLT